MSSNVRPRVTVGIPVYNGAATIEPALRALLDQTFTDVEYVVSDNASTDATGEVVQRMAMADPRIRYILQPHNIGANGNYSFVAQTARGDYLKWGSASDWCAPTFVARCVEALDSNPHAVVAAPRTRFFEGDIESATDYEYDIAILADRPSVRLKDWFHLARWNNAFNGLIRLSALRQTQLVPPYMGSDLVLMGHLAMLGQFVLIDEPLYYRRMEVETTIMRQDQAARVRHHYPTAGARTLFQAWKRQAGWFRAAASTPMSARERMRVLLHLLQRGYWDRSQLGRDLGTAVLYAFGRRA